MLRRLEYVCRIEAPPDRQQRRPRPSAEVVSRRLEGEIVLLHLGRNRIYQLNRTAARLWELLEAGCDGAELHRRMRESFDVDDALLESEIEEILTRLERDGLVVVE